LNSPNKALSIELIKSPFGPVCPIEDFVELKFRLLLLAPNLFLFLSRKLAIFCLAKELGSKRPGTASYMAN